MKAVALLALALACAGIAPSVHSQVVKCRAGSGQLIYTEKNCPHGTEPVELPDSLPKSAGHAPATAPGVKEPSRLSPRAQELMDYVFACVHQSSTECNEYKQIYTFCTNEPNRGTADCRALVELLPQAKREGLETLRKEQRRGCGPKATPEQCMRSTCPYLAGQEFDDEKLFACANAWGFPSAGSWAQVRERKDPAGNWTGDFVCFPKYQFLGPVGEPTWQRGQVLVEAQMSGGRPTGSYLLFGRDLFPSIAAAAEAGCARRNAGLAEKQKRDAQAMAASGR